MLLLEGTWSYLSVRKSAKPENVVSRGKLDQSCCYALHAHCVSRPSLASASRQGFAASVGTKMHGRTIPLVKSLTLKYDGVRVLRNEASPRAGRRDEDVCV